jgi:hypothetical protein
MLILSKKHARNGRLIGLKSHDMHVMVQQILHVCVRHLMHPAQRHAIHAQRIGKIFQRLCCKIIEPMTSLLWNYISLRHLLLESCFSPSFFDIMEHWPLHVVDEVNQCDPVIAYGVIHSYILVLKSYVRFKGDHRSAWQVGICMEKHYTFIPNILHCSHAHLSPSLA